jgi:hypothetical protein
MIRLAPISNVASNLNKYINNPESAAETPHGGRLDSGGNPPWSRISA